MLPLILSTFYSQVVNERSLEKPLDTTGINGCWIKWNFIKRINILAPKYSVNRKIRKYTGKQIVSSGKIKMRDDYN